MADYITDISTIDYIYMREVTITESTSEDHTDLPIKLVLNSSNFNFSLANYDGSDFRLAVRSNGTGVLNYWIAAWDNSSENATIWFKLPELLADEVKTLYAFWGYEDATSESDVTSVNFMFAYGLEDFSTHPLDSSKWVENKGAGSFSENGCQWGSGLTAINAITDTNWILEMGVLPYINDAYGSTTANLTYFYILATENGVNYIRFGTGSYLAHNIIAGDRDTTLVVYDDTHKGFELDRHENNLYLGYNQIKITYYEPTDIMEQGLSERNSYTDYLDEYQRECEGDTRAYSFKIRNGGLGTDGYAQWVIVREYTTDDPVFDTSNLYVAYETVNPQQIDFEEYGDDITNVNLYHESDYGGEPLNLSDNVSESLSSAWVSNNNAATISGGINAMINFRLSTNNIVNRRYLHYDSGHVRYLNASKLSDSDNDTNSNTYWNGTTTSGYACIDFGLNNFKTVGSITLRGVSTDLSALPKNFIFEGGFSDPRFSEDEDWNTLYTGQLEQVSDFQVFHFVNYASYRYYRLNVSDTYGSNIKLQEWEMYEYDESLGSKIVSQLRLTPVVGNEEEKYFPKSIKLLGSNDNTNWSALLNKYPIIPDTIVKRWGENSNCDYTGSIKDSFFSETSPDDHYHTDTILYTGNNGASPLRYRAILKVTNLNAVLSSYNVINAKLYVYLNYRNASTTFDVYRVLQDWIHSQASWNDRKTVVTWNSAGCSAANDSGEDDGSYDCKATGASYNGTLLAGNWVYFDITDIVSGWASGAFNEYGVLIRCTESPWNGVRFYSSEYSTISLRPYLEVTYRANYDLYEIETATPYYNNGVYGRQQRFSFVNDTKYEQYKANCIGNWNNNSGPIKISEWEMVEKASEEYTYRVLGGTTNNINSIWAQEEATFDNGAVYICNEVVNTVANNRLSETQSVSGDIVDLNAI